MSNNFEPGRGDVVWLDLSPQSGHEQAGRRPVLILSPKIYNQRSGLAVVCPITSKIKDYPYLIKIPEDLEVKGVILVDQIKSVDWRIRNANFIFKIPATILKDVIEKLLTLVG